MSLSERIVLVILAVAISLSGCRSDHAEGDREAVLPDDLRIALSNEIESSLEEEVLKIWYPRAVDSVYGGYLTQWDADWQPMDLQDKHIVTQARHVWTTAKAVERYPDVRMYREASRHGFHFLRDKMWDERYGGFFWLVERDGSPKPESPGPLYKFAYGNAFGIYGLAAYYAISRDPEALDLAERAFRWLDTHAHDAEYGGYFQNLERDGTPVSMAEIGIPPKDQNSSIHLLEAFTELYHMWPDSVLGERLKEMLVAIRDTIAGEKNHLTLFSYADWRPFVATDSMGNPISGHPRDHVSFGHDVETAFLMLEAAEALGIDTDPTLQRGKAMIDLALKWGWDSENGGFYDAGDYTADSSAIVITGVGKNWWTQSEGLNALLLFGDLYPDDPQRYHEQFLKQWSYINDNLIDHKRGGWYVSGIDIDPEMKGRPKGGLWKSAYHNGRAMLNVVHRLRNGTERAHGLSPPEGSH